jgi:hypothetical protein
MDQLNQFELAGRQIKVSYVVTAITADAQTRQGVSSLNVMRKVPSSLPPKPPASADPSISQALSESTMENVTSGSRTIPVAQNSMDEDEGSDVKLNAQARLALMHKLARSQEERAGSNKLSYCVFILVLRVSSIFFLTCRFFSLFRTVSSASIPTRNIQLTNMFSPEE